MTRAVPVRPRAELRLLGGFDLHVGGSRVVVAEGVQRTLVFLALHPGCQPRSFVAGSLWPDRCEERAAANLRTALWRLASATGRSVVVADGRSVWLHEDVTVDVLDLLDLLRSRLGCSSVAPSASDQERVVLPLLPGWYDDWVLYERERLSQLRVHCIESMVAALGRAGRHGEAIDLAVRLVDDDPLRERNHVCLVRAYAAEGSRMLALRQYERLRSLTQETFGCEPEVSFEAACAPAG